MRTGRRIAWLGIISIALVFSVQISGCSLIGLVAGTLVDQGKPGSRVLLPREAVEITPGAMVVLLLDDDTSTSGRYLGVGRIPETTYGHHYASWRDSAAAAQGFPALGDSIVLAERSGVRLAAIFGGFGYRQVMIRSSAGGGPGVVPFENLVSLSGPEGRSIPVENLIGLDATGNLPSTTALRTLDRGDTSLTALDRVTRVEIRSSRHGARNGFLIGLAVDAMVVTIAVATYEPPTSSCESSAPYGANVRPLEAPFDTWAGRFVTNRAATGQAARPAS